MENLVLHIEGMSCNHCLNAVNKALASLPGLQVDSVRIGRADLKFDPAKVSAVQIAAAVTDSGYRATTAPTAD